MTRHPNAGTRSNKYVVNPDGIESSCLFSCNDHVGRDQRISQSKGAYFHAAFHTTLLVDRYWLIIIRRIDTIRPFDSIANPI
jgi:hypothetical protein